MADEYSNFQLTFITDVEGNLDYFKKYVELSKVIRIVDASALYPELDFVEPNNPEHYFVFGGDAVDKGPGDIRLTRMFVNFKRKYPDRVFLLLGNRDLNKARMIAELDNAELARFATLQGVYWQANPVTPKQWLDNLIKKEDPDANMPYSDQQYQKVNTLVNKLHWMLESTMGCEQTFETRREELAILAKKEKKSISDHDVLQSYLDGINNGGYMRDYIENGQIIAIIGNSLFVHAHLALESIGFIPGRNEQSYEVNGKYLVSENPKTRIQEWAQALNQWAKQEVEDWKKNPYWTEDHSKHNGGSSLMDYHYVSAAGKKVRLQSVTCNKFMQGTNVEVPKDDLNLILIQSGIHRVIVGHSPFSDSPLIIKPPHSENEYISADTSYSDPKASDRRGSAVFEILISGISKNFNSLRVHGISKDKQIYDFTLPALGKDSSSQNHFKGDELIGRSVTIEDKEWFVQKKFGKDTYQIVKTLARAYEQKTVQKNDLASKL